MSDCIYYTILYDKYFASYDIKSTFCNGVIFMYLYKWRYMTLRYYIVLIIMTSQSHVILHSSN